MVLKPFTRIEREMLRLNSSQRGSGEYRSSRAKSEQSAKLCHDGQSVGDGSDISFPPYKPYFNTGRASSSYCSLCVGDTEGSTIGDMHINWETVKLEAKPTKMRGNKKTKCKSWMPNGGGMKPYNSPEVQRNIVPAETCIIDVKAVRPKVDTWFRPKPKQVKGRAELSRSSSKPNQQLSAAAQLKGKFRVPRSIPPGNREDTTVKTLTSFWNEHLTKYPPGPPADTTNKRSSVESVKGPDLKLKAVGSDGVVQEHTLQPSKILSDKRKLSTVEEVLSFALQGKMRRSESADRLVGVLPTLRTEPDRPSQPEISEESGQTQGNIVPHRVNEDKTEKKGRAPRPSLVVKLRPRWCLLFKVLILTMRPMAALWRQRAESKAAHESRSDGSSLSENALFLKRVSEESVVTNLGSSLKPVLSIVQKDMSTWTNCESMFGSPQPLVTSSISERGPPLQTATLDVLPLGVRITLYFEYQTLFYIVVMHLALVLLALSFKWLQ